MLSQPLLQQLQFKRTPALQHPPSPWRQRRWWLLLGALCLLSSSAAVTAGLLWRGWMQARDELQHQRQLQLIERLKPASEPAPAPAPMPPLRVEIPPVIPPAATLDPAGELPGSLQPAALWCQNCWVW